jgi:hypothetical protein
MKILIAIALSIFLSGCMAGISKYTVEPFYDADSKSVICCRATVINGKNIGSLTAHVVKKDNDFTVDLQESNVVSSASIEAATAPVSSVAKAVSNTAITIQKLSKEIP